MPDTSINSGASDRRTAIIAQPPVARCELSVRVAIPEDLAFIDELQKMHSHMVGWMPRKQIEANIEAERILIAESEDDKVTRGQGDKVTPGNDGDVSCAPDTSSSSSPPHLVTPSPCHSPTPLGYCIARDQYMKRDDVGIMYQVNVLPLKQRHLIGATLVKTVLERAAYGCKLFSLWCAQDLQANWFWEALGFIPLAFRTGSRAKQRIHIFWQRRVRDGDEKTEYWFPSQTAGGAVAEDRIVLPIPPGTHWRDAKPVLLPELPAPGIEEEPDTPKMLPGGAPVRPRPEQPKLSRAERAMIMRSQSQHLKGVPLGKKAVITGSGFKYVERTDFVPELDDAPGSAPTPPPKPKRPRKPRRKHDPKYLAAARDLRDRYLEELNAGNLLPPAACGKYDVSRPRKLEAAVSPVRQNPLLEAA